MRWDKPTLGKTNRVLTTILAVWFGASSVWMMFYYNFEWWTLIACPIMLLLTTYLFLNEYLYTSKLYRKVEPLMGFIFSSIGFIMAAGFVLAVLALIATVLLSALGLK